MRTVFGFQYVLLLNLNTYIDVGIRFRKFDVEITVVVAGPSWNVPIRFIISIESCPCTHFEIGKFPRLIVFPIPTESLIPLPTLRQAACYLGPGSVAPSNRCS